MKTRELALLCVLVAGLVSRVHADPACSALASLKLPDTTIDKAEALAAGPFHVPPKVVWRDDNFDLPAHCRVVGTIRPTPDSAIGFEVWMPASGWNGKYRQVGNGGMAGSYMYHDLGGVLQAGYAGAATDDGHRSDDLFDARWAIGHPERLIDYGSRAVHRTALVAQSIVAAYYGHKPRYRYFTGCSDGGRESLMEAQRYPDDFDGYLVGAPGIDIGNNSISHLHFSRSLASLGTAAQLTQAQIKTLASKALERCDAIDGVKDGVLRDPRQCAFKADELICRGAGDGSCLTAAQASAVQSIYDGPKDPTSGAQLAPGWIGTRGAEDSTWPQLIGSGAPMNMNWLNVLLYGKTETDLAAVDIRQAALDVKKSLAPIINPDSPDLTAVRQAGKKVLMFHGWPDTAVIAQGSVDYFEAVQKSFGSDTKDFYRLFMAPGMAHCGGGFGPTVYQYGPQGADPWHEWSVALEAWVERGTAPDRVIAAEFDGSKLLPGPIPFSFMVPAGTQPKRTRPLCPYPQVAVYRGRGSTDAAANFECRRQSREGPSGTSVVLLKKPHAVGPDKGVAVDEAAGVNPLH